MNKTVKGGEKMQVSKYFRKMYLPIFNEVGNPSDMFNRP